MTVRRRPSRSTETPVASTGRTDHITTSRSTTMTSMHEALAREHMRLREKQARTYALTAELAAANRWRYLERRAHAAVVRHAQRAHRAAQVSAVAE